MYRVPDGGAISSVGTGGRSAVAPRLAMARERLAVPVTVFLVSRCLLLVVTQIAPHLLPRPAHGNRVLLPVSDPTWSLGTWVGSWFRYDSGWYTTIAEHGYHYGPLGTASTNFMPLYPVITRAVQPIALGSSIWLAAWLVANLAFLASLVVLWRWALLRTNRETALQVLVLVACFPFAFFFAAPYAEPVFLALAISAFLLAEQGRWPLAIGVAALSTVTRPVGMAVVLGLMALAWQRGERRWCAAAALACIPLLAFALYLDLSFGHPLAFLTYHSYGWVAPSGGVWHTITEQFHTKLSPFDRVDALLAVLFILSGVVAWVRLGAGYGVYVLVGTVLPLVHGLVSMERYVIVLFPAMAVWAGWSRKVVRYSIFAVSLFGLVLATTMFVQGYAIF